MNNLIKNKSDKMSLHEHKIVSSIENNGINLTNLIYAMNENLVCGFVYTVQYYFNSNSYLYVKNIVRNTLVALAVCGLYVQVQAANVAPWHMHPWVSAPIRTVVEAYLTNAD